MLNGLIRFPRRPSVSSGPRTMAGRGATVRASTGKYSVRGLVQDRGGMAALEFALLVPPLLLLVFGFVAAGTMIFTWTSMQNAAQYAGYQFEHRRDLDEQHDGDHRLRLVADQRPSRILRLLLVAGRRLALHGHDDRELRGSERHGQRFRQRLRRRAGRCIADFQRSDALGPIGHDQTRIMSVTSPSPAAAKFRRIGDRIARRSLH